MASILYCKHALGTISSEVGVQQGDPLSPMFFCLVLLILIMAIVGEDGCSSLFQAWYQDDGVIVGPKHAISQAPSIIQELGPTLGLFINTSKCERYRLRLV